MHCWCEHKLVQPLWKAGWKFLKKLKTKLLFYSTIPILGIYLKKVKTLIWKDVCSPMLIAALFIIAKIWWQLKCTSIDAWIKKKWYVYAVEYYSATKMRSCYFDNVDGLRDYHDYWNNSERKINTVWFHLYAKSKDQNNWTTVTKQK